MANPNWHGGAPPEDKRCTAKLKSGKRCGKWVLRGVTCCSFHGGRQQQNTLRNETTRLEHGADMRYRKILYEPLRKRIEEAEAEQPQAQVQLLEELTIVREVADSALETYSIACYNLDRCETANEGIAEARALRDKATEMMLGTMREVRDFALSAERVLSNTKGQISVHTLRYVFAQVTRIVSEVFEGSDEEKVTLFQAKIDELRLPIIDDSEVAGTSITPDQDALDMDDSVPLAKE